jgi:hypothetical protein
MVWEQTAGHPVFLSLAHGALVISSTVEIEASTKMVCSFAIVLAIFLSSNITKTGANETF